MRLEDLYRACSYDCLDKVLQWGSCTLLMRMQAAEVRGLVWAVGEGCSAGAAWDCLPCWGDHNDCRR